MHEEVVLEQLYSYVFAVAAAAIKISSLFFLCYVVLHKSSHPYS